MEIAISILVVLLGGVVVYRSLAPADRRTRMAKPETDISFREWWRGVPFMGAGATSPGGSRAGDAGSHTRCDGAAGPGDGGGCGGDGGD